MTAVQWEDASTATYTAERTTIGRHVVTVCLDDEGPMRPAFYWDVDDRAVDGWAASVRQARRDAVTAARSMAREEVRPDA